MNRMISADEAEIQARDIYDDTDSLKDLADDFLSQESIVGSPNGFHNLSITYSRHEDYENACRILDMGLKLYHHNVDLLSDFLHSGMNCGRNNDCEKYYNRLMSIPKHKWTWRGFSFSIDYLLRCAENILDEASLNEEEEKILSISDEYKDYFPYNEDAYLSRTEIYKAFNKDDDQIVRIFEHTIQNLKSCAKTAMRYADLLVDRGDYQKALDIINERVISSVTSQPTVSLSYVYYLSGLCKVSLFLEENNQDEKRVEEIYKDFYISRENGVGNTYNLVMEKHIRILEIKTGIKYDEVTAGL